MAMDQGRAIPNRDPPYSDERKAKVNGKKLMCCGIGLGVAVVLPLLAYFVPHLF